MDALRKANNAGQVLGLKGASGVVDRLDIDDLLLNKPDTFNLFLLGLIEIQKPERTRDKMGWYQIGGIHGLPATPWDGVLGGSDKGSQGPFQNGYCTHSKSSFPHWHRSYVAMLEQSLYVTMTDIVEKFPEASRPKYRRALQEFRLPYWDYYRPRAQRNTRFPGLFGGGFTSFPYDFMLPLIFRQRQVMVRRTLDDTLQSVDNPLYDFKFPSADIGGFSKTDWAILRSKPQDRTFRAGGSQQMDLQQISYEINKHRENSVTAMLDMVQDYDSFDVVASTMNPPQGREGGLSNSIEGVHNAYHNHIAGWMASSALAAFDPVFWIHHCNIDRLTAIWEAAHPNAWAKAAVSKAQVSANSFPFRSPNGGYWTCNDVRDTKTFGYSYAGTSGTPTNVKNDFVDLYNWLRRSSPGSTEPSDFMKPFPVQNAQVYRYQDAGQAPPSVGPVLGNAPQAVMQSMRSTAAVVAETITDSVASVAPNLAETIGIAAAAPASDQEPAREEIPVQEAASASEDPPAREEVPTQEPTSQVSIDVNPAGPGTTSHAVALIQMASETQNIAPADVDEGRYFRDWYVDTKVERLAFNEGFTIYIFIGPFDDADVANYGRAPTLAGTNTVFAAQREFCASCEEQADAHALVVDTDPITPMLLDYVKLGQLQDLTPTNVLPFLVKNLKWRVATASGLKKDPRETPGFKIGLSSKLSPNDRSTGDIPLYQEFPQVITEIVGHASETPTS